MTLILSLSLQINRIVAMKLCEIGTNYFKPDTILRFEPGVDPDCLCCAWICTRKQLKE